jgi:hypothetical protein
MELSQLDSLSPRANAVYADRVVRRLSGCHRPTKPAVVRVVDETIADNQKLLVSGFHKVVNLLKYLEIASEKTVLLTDAIWVATAMCSAEATFAAVIMSDEDRFNSRSRHQVAAYCARLSTYNAIEIIEQVALEHRSVFIGTCARDIDNLLSNDPTEVYHSDL